jgi:hypothetical protein
MIKISLLTLVALFSVAGSAAAQTQAAYLLTATISLAPRP